MADNNFNIQEEGSFNDGVPTLKEIVLMHIKKISDICCNEFTPGRWEQKPVKVGGGIAITKKYTQDQRAVFCNAVDFLFWIVFPMSDEEFKKKHGEEIKDSNVKKYGPKKEQEKSGEKIDWEKLIIEKKELFKDINVMFERKNFFDTQTGHTE